MDLDPPTPSTPGPRARLKEAIRRELSEAATHSFLSNGVEGTTVASIAVRVGVSERTFYRHFATKEDAVLQPVEAIGSSIAEELRGRPREEAPLTALRASFAVAVSLVSADPTSVKVVMQLNQSDPTLRTRHLHQQDHWIKLLTEAQLARDDSQPATLVRLQCAVMMLAWEQALLICQGTDDFTKLGAALDSTLENLRDFLASIGG